MEDFLYGMEWKISGMEWNCLEDFACCGRWKIYIPFHRMPWLMDGSKKTVHLQSWHCLATIHDKSIRVAYSASKQRWAPQTSHDTAKIRTESESKWKRNCPLTEDRL